MAIQLINDVAIKWIGDPLIEKFRLSLIHTNKHIKNNHVICVSLRYDIYINEIKKEKKRIDIWIDKVMVIWDIESDQWNDASFVCDRCNSFLCDNASSGY